MEMTDLQKLNVTMKDFQRQLSLLSNVLNQAQENAGELSVYAALRRTTQARENDLATQAATLYAMAMRNQEKQDLLEFKLENERRLERKFQRPGWSFFQDS